MLCICPKEHPLAKQDRVCIDDMKQEVLILESPFIGPANFSELRSFLLSERKSSDLQICDLPEAAVILVKAGFGIAVHAGLSVPADGSLSYIPVDGLPFLSFGVYYKTLKGRPLLKRFIELLREQIVK